MSLYLEWRQEWEESQPDAKTITLRSISTLHGIAAVDDNDDVLEQLRFIHDHIRCGKTSLNYHYILAAAAALPPIDGMFLIDSINGIREEEYLEAYKAATTTVQTALRNMFLPQLTSEAMLTTLQSESVDSVNGFVNGHTGDKSNDAQTTH